MTYFNFYIFYNLSPSCVIKQNLVIEVCTLYLLPFIIIPFTTGVIAIFDLHENLSPPLR